MNEEQVFHQIAEQGTAPILCVADHASNFVPDDIDLGIDASLLNNHIAVDIGTKGVAGRLARRHKFPLHMATVSRLVCDLHRQPHDTAAVPTSSDGHLIAGNIGANFEKRIARFHAPYHEAFADMIDRIQPKLLVALHSFTPKLADGGDDRPWEVGLLYNQDNRAARHAIRLLSEQGLTVGDNEPYSGKLLNATMDRHAETRGIPYLTIEIRQDQIGNEAGQARWADRIADIAARVAMLLD